VGYNEFNIWTPIDRPATKQINHGARRVEEEFENRNRILCAKWTCRTRFSSGRDVGVYTWGSGMNEHRRTQIIQSRKHSIKHSVAKIRATVIRHQAEAISIFFPCQFEL
jgi:hypothetical protein